MPKSTARAFADPAPSPVAVARSAADALRRAAYECVHQHERLGRCLEATCSDEELRHVAEMTDMADAHLEAVTAAYEQAANAAPDARGEPWWKGTNALWHASREFGRRHAGTDRVLRRTGKRSTQLQDLALEYEFERSAFMALKQAAMGLEQRKHDAPR